MDIHGLVTKQHEYFAAGGTKIVDFRLAALGRLRRALVRNQKMVLKALYSDLGKSSSEGYMTEFGLVLEEITHAMKHLTKWARPKARRSSLAQFPGNAYSIREPYGVVLIMSPWNYPFLLTMSPLVGAIAGGNCCVIKPSNDASATSRIIAKIVKEIFPAGYITVVEGGRTENQALLDQRFDYIFFTGGKTVGRIVMEKSSVNLTPFTLELGGKSPCIVDATADINLAAKRIIFGKLINSGQTCIAPDYVLAHESIKQELIEKMQYWIGKFLGKNPLENPDYPRIISQKHYDRLLKMLEGETIVEGGYGKEESLQIAPTILDNVKANAPCMGEEIFGPILPIMSFEYILQAEQFISSREKPLALYLFTQNSRVEQGILRNLSFGGGCVNDTIMHMVTPYMGFGGVGASGTGSYHGIKSFETFTHEKNILKQSTKLDIPFRYQPYRTWKNLIIQKIIK